MKTVYFIRHGESESNAGPASLGFHAALTEKGKREAQFLAKRCAKLPIETIISSTMPRAKDTAFIINAMVKKPLEFSDLFIERRRPKEQVGVPRKHPQAVKAEKTIFERFTEPDFRYSDEENFSDLKKRADQALSYLEKRPEDNILVVTHGTFMRVLLARVIFGPSLTSQECLRFIHAARMGNVGLTEFEYNTKQIDSPWRLWTWNDQAHLAE